MLLPDKIMIGRSAESPRSSRLCANASTSGRACPIGELAPVAAAGAFGQEQPFRLALNGGAEEAGEARMVRRQRLARTAVQAAVVGALVTTIRGTA